MPAALCILPRLLALVRVCLHCILKYTCQSGARTDVNCEIKRKYTETWENRKNEKERKGERKFDEKIRIESETKIYELM